MDGSKIMGFFTYPPYFLSWIDSVHFFLLIDIAFSSSQPFLALFSSSKIQKLIYPILNVHMKPCCIFDERIFFNSTKYERSTGCIVFHIFTFKPQDCGASKYAQEFNECLIFTTVEFAWSAGNSFLCDGRAPYPGSISQDAHASWWYILLSIQIYVFHK
jgi:hypothetical protein